MKNSPTLSLLWKDYRAQRGLWLGLLGMIYLFSMITNAIMNDRLSLEGFISDKHGAISIFTTIFSVIYAIAFGATVFGNERENRSARFLQTLPIPAWRIVLTRFALGFTSTIFLLAVPVSIHIFISSRDRGLFPDLFEDPVLLDFVLTLSLIFVKAILWGFLFSILWGRVLVAVACSTILSLIIPFMRYEVVSAVAFDPVGYWLYPYYDILSVVALILLNVAVYHQWSRGKLQLRFFHRTEKHRTDVSKITRWKKTPKNSFRSLLWVSRKEVFRASRIPVIVAGAICLIGYLVADAVSFDFSIIIIPFIPIFMGAWVYRDNHLRQTNRFYAVRGVSATKFWIAKQLVWFSATLLVFFAFLGIDIFFEKIYFWERLLVTFGFDSSFFVRYNINLIRNKFLIPDTGWGNFLFTSNLLLQNLHYCLFAYCSAMFCSRWFHKTITAFAVSVIVTVSILGWWFLMNWFGLPVFWTVYPIIAGMVLGSFLSTGDWLLERAKFFQRIRTAGITLTAFALVVTGVASFRLLSLPEADKNSFRYRFPVYPAENALETGRMYRRATAFLVSQVSIEKTLPESARTRKPHPTLESWDVGVINGWEFSTEAERKWLEENRETLERTIAAAKRPSCAMENPYDETATPHYEQKRFLTEKLESLFRLLLFSAKKLESEGKLAESWNHYHYAMRMCWHLDEHPHDSFRTYHSRIYDWIGTWRLHPNQTAEILRKALEDLKAGSIAKKDQRTEIAMMQIERAKKFAFEGEADSRSADEKVHDSIRRMAAFFMPWEKTRALRVLKIVRYNEQENLKTYPSLMLLPQIDRFILAPNVINYRIITPLEKIENLKSLLMIRLALNIEKRKTGKYPKRLDDLLGEYFDKLPRIESYQRRSGIYRYFPNGLPNDLLYEGGGKIKANTPFLFNPFSYSRFILIKASDIDNKLKKDYFILSYDRPKPDSSKKLVVGDAYTIEAAIRFIDK